MQRPNAFIYSPLELPSLSGLIRPDRSLGLMTAMTASGRWSWRAVVAVIGSAELFPGRCIAATSFAWRPATSSVSQRLS
jgi:hypothetical protein